MGVISIDRNLLKVHPAWLGHFFKVSPREAGWMSVGLYVTLGLFFECVFFFSGKMVTRFFFLAPKNNKFQFGFLGGFHTYCCNFFGWFGVYLMNLFRVVSSPISMGILELYVYPLGQKWRGKILALMRIDLEFLGFFGDEFAPEMLSPSELGGSKSLRVLFWTCFVHLFSLGIRNHDESSPKTCRSYWSWLNSRVYHTFRATKGWHRPTWRGRQYV